MARSRFFQFFDPTDPENAEFKRDVQLLAGLEPPQLDAVRSAVADFATASDPSTQLVIVERVASETGLPQVSVVRARWCLRAFLLAFMRPQLADESAESVAADLLESDYIPPEAESRVAGILGEVHDDVLPVARRALEEVSAGRGVLPFLQGCETTVELRGIFDRQYEPAMDVSSYEPAIRNVTGIVSLHLSLDAGAKDVYFQADARGLRSLINELEAALKSLDRLTAVVQPEAIRARAGNAPVRARESS